MQRYNPVFDAVRRLIQTEVLGEHAPRLLSRTTPRTRTCRPSTGSGTAPRAAASSSSTASTSSTCSPAGSDRDGSRPPRSAVRPGTADRGARPVHGPLRDDGPGQLLPRLPPGRPDGPAGTAAGLRAGRRDTLRLGADPGRIHAIADEGQTRDLCDLFPGHGSTWPPPTAARTAPARAGTRRSTSTR